MGKGLWKKMKWEKREMRKIENGQNRRNFQHLHFSSYEKVRNGGRERDRDGTNN